MLNRRYLFYCSCKGFYTPVEDDRPACRGIWAFSRVVLWVNFHFLAPRLTVTCNEGAREHISRIFCSRFPDFSLNYCAIFPSSYTHCWDILFRLECSLGLFAALFHLYEGSSIQHKKWPRKYVVWRSLYYKEKIVVSQQIFSKLARFVTLSYLELCTVYRKIII
jgi:hypothetical protein